MEPGIWKSWDGLPASVALEQPHHVDCPMDGEARASRLLDQLVPWVDLSLGGMGRQQAWKSGNPAVSSRQSSPHGRAALVLQEVHGYMAGSLEVLKFLSQVGVLWLSRFHSAEAGAEPWLERGS